MKRTKHSQMVTRTCTGNTPELGRTKRELTPVFMKRTEDRLTRENEYMYNPVRSGTLDRQAGNNKGGLIPKGSIRASRIQLTSNTVVCSNGILGAVSSLGRTGWLRAICIGIAARARAFSIQIYHYPPNPIHCLSYIILYLGRIRAKAAYETTVFSDKF